MTYFMVESVAALLAFFLLGALIGCLLKGFFWPAAGRVGHVAARPYVEPAPILPKVAPIVVPPRPSVPPSSVTITPAAIKPAMERPAGVSPELSAAAAAASAATLARPAAVVRPAGPDPAMSAAAIAAAAAAAAGASAMIRRDQPAAGVEVARPAVMLGDDLKRIRGIGPEIERRLNALGITRYAQLAGWSAEDVARFNSELGFDRRIQKENWIEQAAVLAKEGETVFSRRVDAKEVSSGADTWTPTAPRMVEQAALAAATAAAASAALQPKPVIVKPAEVIAPAMPDSSGLSVRERATAALTGGDFKVSARLPEPELPSASGFSGGVAVAGAVAAVAPKVAGLWDDIPGSKSWDDLKLVRTIDPSLEAQLRELGVRKYSDIANWTPTDVARYAKILAAGDRIDRERWIEQARRLSGDSVSLMTGASVVGASAAQMGASASSLTASAIAEADLVGSRINKRGDGDDLTLIRGVGQALQTKLYDRGVTRFAQLASMSEADILKLGVDLGIGDLAAREGWVSQARSMMPTAAAAAVVAPVAVAPIIVTRPAPAVEAPAAPSVLAKAAPGAIAVAAAAVAAAGPARAAVETVAVNDQASPQQDLKLIKGISVDIERGLNGLGIRRYADIARWTPSDVDRFGTTLGIKGRIEREFWVQQAQILARGGETDFSRRIASGASALGASAAIAGAAAAGSAVLARTAAAAPAGSSVPSIAPASVAAAASASGSGMTRIVKSSAADDLKRIRGIGIVVENKLRALGVVNYHHIAEWSAADIDRISTALEFSGRVERENWIAQARILAGGGQTDFSRRVDRGEVDPRKA